MWEFSQWARSDPIRMMHEAEAIINQILDQGGAGAGFLPLSGGTMTGPLTVKDNNLIVQNGGDYSVAVDGSGRLTTTPTAGGTTLTFASRTGYADTVVNNPVG